MEITQLITERGEELLALQQLISDATGMANVIVNAQGKPVSELVGFCPFCCEMRKRRDGLTSCMASDAYGCVQGSIDLQSHLYLCHVGLLEIAVPIVVDGRYLGGFITGQVHCPDAPSEMIRVNRLTQSPTLALTAAEKTLCRKIPTMGYAQCSALAKIIEKLISQFCQQVCLKPAKQGAKAQPHSSKARPEQPATRQMILDSLISAANLAIIEGAVETNAYLVQLSDFIKTAIFGDETYWTVEKETAHIADFLKLQGVRLGDKLQIDLQVPEELAFCQIPAGIWLAFMTHTTGPLLMAGGSLRIEAAMTGDQIVLRRIHTPPYKDQPRQCYAALSTCTSAPLPNAGLIQKQLEAIFGEGICEVEALSLERGEGWLIRVPNLLTQSSGSYRSTDG